MKINRFFNLRAIEQFLFYGLIVAVPITTRHIFNYDVLRFSEWRAISLYGTDIIFGILLIMWGIRSKFKIVITNLKVSDYILLAFLGIAAISIKNAIDIQVAWYQWLKLSEGILFYLYITHYAWKVFDRESILLAFVLGGFFQALVAIGQFASQQSIGLRLFGESVLNPAMTGIAAFISNGVKIIRAYGTTPHPNVLAAYLLVALVACWVLYPRFKNRWVGYMPYVIILWGLFVTFSRTVIGIWVLLGLIFSFRYWKEYRRLIAATAAVLVVFVVSYWPYVINRATISTNDEAVSLRVLYNHQALSGGIHWFGVGVGNFVPWLMGQAIHLPLDQYQPVHNIFLLMYAELGLVGVVVFILWLLSLFRQVHWLDIFANRSHSSLAMLFVGFLSIGLFDHFFWTIQSGQLLFWLIAGLRFVKIRYTGFNMATRDKTELLRAIKDEVLSLKSSPLYADRIKNKVFPVIGEGSHDAKIMFIGEAPGKNEAATGRPFAGAAGKILDQLLASVGIDRKDIYITNIVKDRPPFNRDPLPDEIEIYGPFLDRQIEIIRPEIIATLGRFSMEYVMRRLHLESELGPISKLHGQKFAGKTSYGKVIVIPLYHPAVAIYNQSSKDTLMQDFKILEKYK